MCYLTSFFLLADLKKSRAGAKIGKGSHGSSNAYMLVYSRRDASKSESISRSPATNKASILPQWVQATLDKENEKFDSWNRDTVFRKVCSQFAWTFSKTDKVNVIYFS